MSFQKSVLLGWLICAVGCSPNAQQATLPADKAATTEEKSTSDLEASPEAVTAQATAIPMSQGEPLREAPGSTNLPSADTKQKEPSLLGFQAPTNAATKETGDLVLTMANRAALVFQGRVRQVRFLETASIDRVSGVESKMPVTAVVYSVEKVIQGRYSNDSITLYFPGGYDAKSDTFVGADGLTPMFNEGDEDILFVKDPAKLAPLVKNGRLPVVNGKVYTSESLAVEAQADGTFVAGSFSPQRGILEHRIGRTTFVLERANELGVVAKSVVANPVHASAVEERLKGMVTSRAVMEIRTLTDEAIPAIEWRSAQ